MPRVLGSVAGEPVARGDAGRTGRRLGRLLAGAWRPEAPPDSDLTVAELGALAPLLVATGCGGLAWRRVRERFADEPAAWALRDAGRRAAIESAVRETQLAASVRELRARGVEPLTAKGWAAGRSYPTPGLRPPGDIDLYVPPATSSVLSGRLTVAVDLHVGCAELDDRPWSVLLDRSVLVATRGGENVRIFGPEDHLRLMSLHMFRHGAWRPLWLCDIAAALEARPTTFDWEHLLAGDSTRTDWVACALALAGELLGADLVGTPPRIRETRPPAWLRREVLELWGRGSFEPHGRRMPLASLLRSPRQVASALRTRWPTATEAALALGVSPLRAWPRLTLQLGASAMRVGFFLRRAGRRP